MDGSDEDPIIVEKETTITRSYFYPLEISGSVVILGEYEGGWYGVVMEDNIHGVFEATF